VNEVKDSSNLGRLIPFEFSTQQAYILEFGDQYIRFYKDGGVILSGGTPYEISSPYADTDLSGIAFAQSADVLYIANASYAPRKLSRTSDTTWTLEEIEFATPPFQDEQVSTTTMTASAASGSGITLTASAATFQSDHVGAYVRFIETLESYYTEWAAGTGYSSGAQVQLNGNLYIATNTATSGTKAPVHTSGTISDGGVNWTYQNSGEGYAQITAFTDDQNVTADVIVSLGTTSTSGTVRWSISSWNAVDGYPQAVTFFEDRLWWGGSTNFPQTLWASKSGDYENHMTGINDDDALRYTIGSQEVNSIQSLVPGKVLFVGTAGNEFIVAASSRDEAITPSNIRITPQTSRGSAFIRPFKIDNAVLFVQRSGRRLREFIYNFQNDSYVSPSMTLLAEHIMLDAAVDMTFQQEPYQIFWIPTSTGELLGFTYERSEDVVAWHTHQVGGVVESVATIPHWDGDQDVTFLLVNRTIDGNTVRYVEYIEKYLEDDYAFFLDSGLTYDGSPATTITGLDHLEGETVSVITDGATHPDRVVASGEITLNIEASIVSVGLGFTSKVVTMPLDGGSSDGTSQGKVQRVHELVMRLNNTGPGIQYGTEENNLATYYTRGSDDLMDEPVPLFTGDTEILHMPSGYEQSPSLVVTHNTPLPCILVALMPQIRVYDR
jgi:hypothetical protein